MKASIKRKIKKKITPQNQKIKIIKIQKIMLKEYLKPSKNGFYITDPTKKN